MIVTDLDHIDHQVPMTPSLRKAFGFLRARDLLQLPDGRVDIDGDRVFALVQRYETVRTEVPKYDCHRKSIDVQFIVTGEEVIGWAPAYILPEYQNQGLGTQLLNSLLAEAARQNLAVTLRALKGNPARRLYERLGFKTIEENETHYIMRATPMHHPVGGSSPRLAKP